MSDPVNLNSGTPRQILSLNEQVQMYLGEDMHTRWVGPVYPPEFLRNFMSIYLTHMLEYEKMRDTIKFESPLAEDTSAHASEKEGKLYTALVSDTSTFSVSPDLEI